MIIKKAAKFANPTSVIGFADFEAELKKIQDVDDECINSVVNDKSITVKQNLHKMVSYSLLFVDNLGNLIYEKNYCGSAPGTHFLNTLNNIEEKLLLTICKNKAPLDIRSLSYEELQKFNNATHCDVCHIKFDQTNRLTCKNLDHCHYTNKFRSVSCTLCNLLNRSQNHIPIYIHNYGAYDSKLLLNAMNKNTKIRITPQCLFSNLQKIRCMTYNSYKFKDSIEHLPSSLSKLVQELNNPHQKHSFPIFNQSVIIKSFLSKNNSLQNNKENLKLLTQGKGIFPYGLCSNSSKMKKIKKFPKIDAFFNDLTNTSCTINDYNFL